MRKTMVAMGAAGALLVVLLLALNAGKAPAPEAPPAPQAHQGTPPPGSAGHGSEPGAKPEAPSENARLMLAYPITMARLEAYMAAVQEIRIAGQADAALMARLRAPGPAGETPSGMAARLDAIPGLKAILDRHGLTGIDLVAMPQVVMEGKRALAEEQQGRPLPPDHLNAACMALYRADRPKMEALGKMFMADLSIISGP